MPKVNFVPKDKKLTEAKEEGFVENSDPSTFAMSYPVALKPINNLHFAVDHVEVDTAIYGLFEDKKLSKIICGMEVEFISGETIGIPEVKQIPVIQMISTKESERGKGNAKLLYEAVLNRHRILISGDELYSDEGEVNKSLGLWINHLPKLGTVFNYSMTSKSFSKFSLDEATNTTYNKEMRFCLIQEGLKNALRAGVLSAAMGASTVAHSAETPTNFQSYYKNEPAPHVQQAQAPKQDEVSPGLKDVMSYIEENEGRKNTVYRDSKGHPTIGVGFNLDRRSAKEICRQMGLDYHALKSGEESLSDGAIDKIFLHDVKQSIATARDLVSNFDDQPFVIQKTIIDLAFNLGPDGLADFDHFLTSIEQSNYQGAIKSLRHSLLYHQARNRTIRNINLIASVLKKNLSEAEIHNLPRE